MLVKGATGSQVCEWVSRMAFNSWCYNMRNWLNNIKTEGIYKYIAISVSRNALCALCCIAHSFGGLLSAVRGT